MTKPASQERTIASQTVTSWRDRGPQTPATSAQSLPAAEIEALLKMAREQTGQPAADERDEELGPGDVQYLRGRSMTHQNSAGETGSGPHWPESSHNPDSLLQQAERQLADAILNSGHEPMIAAVRSDEIGSHPLPARTRPASRPGLTLEDLGDLDLDITIELGRAEILIEDVLRLREGSVVSLDKLAGDPVDIIANGRLVARGELLVIDGKFGVRLSEVL